jgi:putative ABC transport system permease protein
VTLQQAQADLDAVSVGLEKQYPETNTSWRLRLVPLPDELLGNVRTPLYVLLGAVAFVLLIACANVANLLLARAANRQKEIAIRSAMGAGRKRIVRQLLTESVLLSVAGGAIGLLLAVWGTEALVKLAADSIPRASGIGVDNRVLGFTMLLSLLTGVVFGLAPAMQASRPDFNESLKEGGKGSGTGTRNSRTRGVLVVAEIALALVLLVGAGLLIQSFRRLQDVDPGFDPRNVLTMRLYLPESKYGEPGRPRIFFEQLLQRVGALPGVQAVGTTTHLPMRGGGDTYFKIEGRPFSGTDQQITALNPAISHDYLRAQGIPLVKGRAFTEQETKETPRVTIINENFARTYFPNEDPLGKRLIIDDGQPLPCEIIGVARDIKQFSLAAESTPTMYMPRIETGFANVVVRTAGDPVAVASAVRASVLAIDKDQPVANVRSMEEILSSSVAGPRFRTLLLGIFAVVALGLAAVGIYGVMSYTVTQRTREIGIRMALGARGSDVLRLVVRQGITLALVGVATGVGVALALTHLLTGMLFNVSATDPATFAIIALLLITVALLACWIPARRATKVDPMVALRYE